MYDIHTHTNIYIHTYNTNESMVHVAQPVTSVSESSLQLINSSANH